MATAPQHVSLASMNRDVSVWVDEVAKLTQPDHIFWCDGSDAEFHVLERELIAAKELLPLNAQSFPGCVLSRSNPFRRCPGRAPDLRLHPQRGRRRPEQSLDRAREGPCADGCAVCGLHEGSHHVRRALLHGPDRFAVFTLRSRDYRQRLRGAQHAAHDPHGTRGARAHQPRRHLCAGTAFHRRSQSQAPLHHALPGRTVDQELWLRLWRQCPARQEVPCAAHRQLAGTHRRLARRAHAHRRHRESAGRDSLPGLRLPLGLRQDQFGHADPARELQGLESMDGGR